jgi:hypothetical protein
LRGLLSYVNAWQINSHDLPDVVLDPTFVNQQWRSFSVPLTMPKNSRPQGESQRAGHAFVDRDEADRRVASGLQPSIAEAQELQRE